jgi:ABC-type Fe3+/spermidine/putrescine transport system ATPase subunit
MQMELIKLKSQLDVTVIYVTHDQEEALVMSDRVVVMADGVIQQIGTPADLYSRPANRFVADFIGEANILEGTLRSVGEAFEIEIPDGTVFAAAGAAVATGERVAVVVRPESVVLGPAAAACRNAFEGRVEQAIYVGDAMRYVVQLPSGQSISAKLPHRAGGDAIAAGDRIRLGWDVESAWVVPCDAPLAESAWP